MKSYKNEPNKNPYFESETELLNVSGSSAKLTSAAQGYTVLIDLAISFGVSYLTAKSEGKKNEELLLRMSELDDKSAQELKKVISESGTQQAKTKAIFDFFINEDLKKLQEDRKKEKILPLIGLGFATILLLLIFYKLQKINNA